MAELPAEILKVVDGPIGNPEVIGLLEKMLVEARAGRMVAIGIVQVAAPHQVSTATAGPALMEIYTGAGVMGQQVLAAMTSPQKRSNILMPARMHG